MRKLLEVSECIDFQNVEILERDLVQALKEKHHVFLCGNGGSAANANHIANDLLYGIVLIERCQSAIAMLEYIRYHMLGQRYWLRKRLCPATQNTRAAE